MYVHEMKQIPLCHSRINVRLPMFGLGAVCAAFAVLRVDWRTGYVSDYSSMHQETKNKKKSTWNQKNTEKACNAVRDHRCVGFAVTVDAPGPCKLVSSAAAATDAAV